MTATHVSEKATVMVDQLANYRRIANLPDGTRVLLRPMLPADRAGMIELFSQVSGDDLRFLRQRVSDPAIVERWFEHYDLRRVFPLLALVNDHMVGDATLHVGEGPDLAHRGGGGATTLALLSPFLKPCGQLVFGGVFDRYP